MSSERVVIPLIVRKGKLVPFYGGEMPEFKEGWIMDLNAEANSFADKSQIHRFNLEETVIIHPKGKELFAIITDRGGPLPPLFPIANLNTGLTTPSGHFFVPFAPQEDLRLLMRGTRVAELQPCICDIGLEEGKMPASINEAYTRISEKLETWRRSHAGNVFSKVYFIDEDGEARPLSVLRDRAQAKLEKKLFALSGELPLTED